MAILLARTADRLYWGARYAERAEDTARIVRAYNDLVTDFPGTELLRWEPLAAIAGSATRFDLPDDDPAGERTVLRHLLADPGHASSILSSVRASRENLRTTREVMPREAWQAINQLSQYVEAASAAAIERQLRDRYLLRVVEISRRLDGILESTMTRSPEYRMFRLGRLVERADMTTRVLGVTAAGLLQLDASNGDRIVAEEVRWMSVLRSVSALQMYQRAVRGPIDAMQVVRFLLGSRDFPRAVQGCFDEIREVLRHLPGPGSVVAALDDSERALAEADPDVTSPTELDRAMDRVQIAISELDRAIHDRYVGGAPGA